MIRLPFGIGRNEILFSLKTFVAAAAALWLALQLNLEKPYWAMATVYIVMQPLAAAVTSKAVFRVMGTFLGAAAAVVMVPNLVTVPELLCLVLAGWVGLCLFISLLDRTPRSYVAMLAGYTGAIVTFMSVGGPSRIFEVALSRTEEITVGILCSAVMARLVMPRPLGPQLAARLDTWMADAGRWAGDVLSGRPDPQTSERDRHRLATDTTEMLALTTHLPYDTSELRHVAGRVRDLQAQMTALLPLLSSLDERLGELRRGGPVEGDLAAVLDAVARWIGGEPGSMDARGLLAKLDEATALLRRSDAVSWSWRDLLALSLLARLRDLVEVWDNCLSLRADIASGRARRPPFRGMLARYAGGQRAHVDVASAALAGLAVGVSILVCCAFWIATGWHDGSGAAQMTAIFFSLFAVMDNPVPVMRLFGRYTFYAIVAVGLLQFIVLPFAGSYVELAVLCAPFLLLFGAMMATPKWGVIGFLMCVNLPLATMIDTQPNLDLAAYINNGIASMIGILMATATAAVLTAVGTERGIARLLRANSRDLAQIAGGSGGDRSALVRRLVDRFALLVQRLLSAPGASVSQPQDVMGDLRVGLNMADLARVRRQLPPLPQEAVEGLLLRLAAHFRARLSPRNPLAAPPVAEIDRVLGLLSDRHDDRPAVTMALAALVGLRCALGADAPEPVALAMDQACWSPAT